MRVMCFAIALVTFSASALASDSADYARMGANAWNAFECAALAGELKWSDKEQSLFTVGYERGMAFVDAVRAGHVTKRDVFTTVPSGFMSHAIGPNNDFILGRVFEVARQSALRDVPAQGTLDEQKSAASRKYSANNCETIVAEY